MLCMTSTWNSDTADGTTVSKDLETQDNFCKVTIIHSSSDMLQ